MRHIQEPRWNKAQSFFKNAAPKKLQDWLTNKKSLTHLLTCACNQQHESFRVHVIKECWEKPLFSEAKSLGMKNNELSFIRQVYLKCGDSTWVYARTVIPQSTLHGELQKLTNLGTQPLGAILFANPHISRGTIEIAKLTKKHTMFEMATKQNYTQPSISKSISKPEPKTTQKPKPEIWGRRSVFTITAKPLLVTEIFLPDLP